jgi:hypothetical protein
MIMMIHSIGNEEWSHLGVHKIKYVGTMGS